jgi:DNA-binding HxlR family transcriptional regulator
MPTHVRHGRSDCPIARSLDVLGDKWTLLVVRETLSGTTRFMDFSRALRQLARTILSERLQRLVDLGVIETVPVSPKSLYHEYVLTEMGRQLFPVVTALRQWGGEYLFEPSEPRQCLVDRRTETPVAPVQVRSVDGRVVLPEGAEVVMRQPERTNQYRSGAG